MVRGRGVARRDDGAGGMLPPAIPSEDPNISDKPNPRDRGTADTPATTDRLEAVARTIAAYEALSQRLMGAHAPEFTDVDLTMSQAKLLYVATVEGSMSMSRVAARLGISASTATEAVDRLVDLRLLERLVPASDRRHVLVRPTSDGIAVLEHLRELNARHLRTLLGRLDADELGIVERAIGILDRAVQDAGPPITRTSTSTEGSRS